MNIKIYQVNMDRDNDRVAFMSLDSIERFQHTSEINSAIYDKVFEGEVDCESLEDVFRMFNTRHPDGYCGRSLSVSDVVEVTDPPKVVGEIITSRTSHTYTNYQDFISQQDLLREQGVHFTAHDYTGMDKYLFEPGCYFCDSIGFQKVDFQPELTVDRSAEKSIRVVLVEPGKVARPAVIRCSLEGMQSVVGGYIEAVYPFEEEVAIVCNEEGKINGMALNRAIRTEEEITDMTYGELTQAFRESEKNGEHMLGYIVFTADSFDKPYPEEARTYFVSSNNKAFQAGMGGYSIYGSSVDGSDPCVRLDGYMAAEKGGKDGWKIERCYTKEPGGQIVDIVAGTFFVCDCSGESFGSLSDEQLRRYTEKFKNPEHFFRTAEGITAVPYTPKEKDHGDTR